jgi:hypothetical protein
VSNPQFKIVECPDAHGVRRPWSGKVLDGDLEKAAMKYSILIYGSEAIAERLSPEVRNELLAGHRALQSALAKRGGFATAQLMPTTSAVTVKVTSTTPPSPLLVTDGPFADTKEQFLGFYVAEFASLEEATLLSQSIASPGVTLEVRPISWVGGVLNEL